MYFLTGCVSSDRSTDNDCSSDNCDKGYCGAVKKGKGKGKGTA